MTTAIAMMPLGFRPPPPPLLEAAAVFDAAAVLELLDVIRDDVEALDVGVVCGGTEVCCDGAGAVTMEVIIAVEVGIVVEAVMIEVVFGGGVDVGAGVVGVVLGAVVGGLVVVTVVWLVVVVLAGGTVVVVIGGGCVLVVDMVNDLMP